MQTNRYHYLTKNLNGCEQFLSEEGYEMLRGDIDATNIVVDTHTKTFWRATDDELDRSRRIVQDRDSQNINEITVKGLTKL